MSSEDVPEVQWVRVARPARPGGNVEDVLQRIADKAAAAPADGPVSADLAAQAKDLALQLKDLVIQIKQADPYFFSSTRPE